MTELLERPRDRPWRTAIGAAGRSLVLLIFTFGAADRIYVLIGLSYQVQLWIFRVLVFVLPPIVLLVTRRICLNLQEIEEHDAEEERAEEEASETAARVAGMKAERSDLSGAVGKLRQGIEELNAEGRERLLAAFEVINGHFQSLFKTLFGGGQAELRLIESDDPLYAWRERLLDLRADAQLREAQSSRRF